MEENPQAVNQKTIRRSARVEGVGLHTGKSVRVEFKPAPSDSGITFVRTDLAGSPPIVAAVASILDANRRPRRTSIGNGVVEVHTIEHLMASCFGLGIDNLLVEISGEEVPGLDGSAHPFLEIFKQAGLQEQEAPRRVVQVREPVWVEEDSAVVAVLPDERFRISYTLSYPVPSLSSQYFSAAVTPQIFESQVAPSRTFCLAQEVEALRKTGLGKGATYENTVVVDGNGKILNNHLRYPDEFVRHKVLDLIGDLYLLGRPLQGHVLAIRSGHALNLKLLQRLRQMMERGREGGIKATYIEPEATSLDIFAIQRILPHRYPFLLVDKVVELVPERRAVGIKNVTINEPFFAGHFPKRPVMPGVMIIEALAQVGGILLLNKPENLGKYAYFVAMDSVRFRRTVLPGDTLTLEAEVLKIRSKTGQMRTRALVEGRVVAEADLMFALLEGDEKL
ncbi:MAG: bifunctional UDP-3-O-[3-hydroxymyristoyl] N-acetylglucosamine deacetylase/3-hydroxyacyl-ACP dehydratase [Candidatus Omnitrophica bacterium]|nr:bifunctional UDP-3-O-[3-hydroxymyristoyl] N-acetylglucosamine deacetylase/3-hydroxyacyl-ACP dehydratase [Candidatus Omnitrophota bacterium]